MVWKEGGAGLGIFFFFPTFLAHKFHLDSQFVAHTHTDTRGWSYTNKGAANARH